MSIIACFKYVIKEFFIAKTQVITGIPAGELHIMSFFVFLPHADRQFCQTRRILSFLQKAKDICKGFSGSDGRKLSVIANKNDALCACRLQRRCQHFFCEHGGFINDDGLGRTARWGV